MKPYLLGIDIGTSACKVAVFEKSGTVVAAANGDYPVYYPKEGWAEQNPEEWWSAVCQAVKKVIEKAGIQPEEIAGIGIDGQSWSAIAMDKDGNVLTNTPIWMDTRAQSICDRLNEEIGADKIFEVSGNSLQPSYTTAKILWYKENLPEVYAKIDKILQSNSYIAYKLTGVMSQDVSQGYGLHCFDMRKAAWDEEMCKKLGIPMGFLPEICDCDHVVGTVTEKAAEESGLAVGTPVVAGGLDAACGTLGAGVIHPGETQEQGGQAGGMSICMDEYKADPRLILGYHVVPGQWLLQGGTTGGGGVMRWFEREFADYERSVAEEKGTTKNSALEKLKKMTFLVGKSDSWHEEGIPQLAGKSLYEDMALVRKSQNDLRHVLLSKLPKDEIGNFCYLDGFSISAVNAFYYPYCNSVFVLPNIILPPFYDESQSDAMLYALVAVFGHEITHGFDDEGALFDAVGRFKNWWTVSDQMAFKEKTDLLVDCYNHLPLFVDSDGYHVNGEQTLGENIADLGGLEMSLQVYEEKLKEQGFYGEELVKQEKRFFQAYANIWRAKLSDDYLMNMYGGDVHAPSFARVNGCTMNCDRWYELFDVKWGDMNYLKPEKRARIW